MKRYLILCASFALAVGAHAAPDRLSPDEARHLLLRTGFAPSASEVAAITGVSADRAIVQIIASAKQAKPLHPLPADALAAPPLRDVQNMSPDARKMMRRDQVREGFEIKDWWMREM